MIIIRNELILIIIIVLSSVFIALTIIMFSLSAIVNKSSKLNDESMFKELKY